MLRQAAGAKPAVRLTLPAIPPSPPCRRALPYAGGQLSRPQCGREPSDCRGPAAGLGGALRWAWRRALLQAELQHTRCPELHSTAAADHCLHVDLPFPLFLPAAEEYVAKAVALTSDVPRLAQLRAGLRQRMLQVGSGWGVALNSAACVRQRACNRAALAVAGAATPRPAMC